MDKTNAKDSALSFAQWWALQDAGEKAVWVCVALFVIVAVLVTLDRLK